MGLHDRGDLGPASVTVAHANRSGGFRPNAIRRVDQTDMLLEGAMADKLFLGVDVAAEWIDVAIYGRAAVDRLANTAEVIAAYLARFEPDQVGLVAFEPTGGYERVLRRELAGAGLAFARVHPNALVGFRRARRQKAKTDRIDARLLADYAANELARRGLAPWSRGTSVCGK